MPFPTRSSLLVQGKRDAVVSNSFGRAADLGFCSCPVNTNCQLLRVLSFNVWWDRGEPLKHICEVIRQTVPDLVGLQECSWESAQSIATECDLYVCGNPNRQQPVLSRWPVEMCERQLCHGRGYRVRLPGGDELLWYNVHLKSYPYAPYVLHGFSEHVPDPWDDPFAVFEEPTPIAGRVDAALLVERQAQLPGLVEILDDLGTATSNAKALLLLTGDFNAASHLDCPSGFPFTSMTQKPSWACSLECAARGLTDCYAEARRRGRAACEPAHTWAAKADQEPHGVHDRIDFVYHGPGLETEWSIHLDGTNSGVPQWPSDHRAVFCVLRRTWIADKGRTVQPSMDDQLVAGRNV